LSLKRPQTLDRIGVVNGKRPHTLQVLNYLHAACIPTPSAF